MRRKAKQHYDITVASRQYNGAEILKDLQYDDNKIKEILGCSDNALRVLKSQIKRK